MAETTFTGGCLCGAVRVEASGAPTRVNYCHCRSCRKASGAPVVAWATFPTDKVRFDPAPTWFRSSDKAERAFCAKCGSPMGWRLLSDPGHVDVTTVTFDRPDDPALKPTDHLWMDAKVAWFDVADDLPRYHEFRSGPRLK